MLPLLLLLYLNMNVGRVEGQSTAAGNRPTTPQAQPVMPTSFSTPSAAAVNTSTRQQPVTFTVGAIGSSTILILLIVASGAVGFAARARVKERERLNKECLISFATLRPIAHVDGGEGDGSQRNSVSTSMSSLERQRAVHVRSRVSNRSSTSSKMTGATDRAELLVDTEYHAYYKLEVVTRWSTCRSTPSG